MLWENIQEDIRLQRWVITVGIRLTTSDNMSCFKVILSALPAKRNANEMLIELSGKCFICYVSDVLLFLSS